MNYSCPALHDSKDIFSRCLLIFKVTDNEVFDLGTITSHGGFVRLSLSSDVPVDDVGFRDTAQKKTRPLFELRIQGPFSLKIKIRLRVSSHMQLLSKLH
jgi:hypothetical protein